VLERIEEIDWHESAARRERAVRSAREGSKDGSCEAILAWLSDGRYVFLTPGRKLVRVTGVVRGETTDEVEEIVAREVEEGDFLLMPSSADTDLIRKLADRALPEDARSRASLWRDALRLYVMERDLTITELQALLASEGCQRHRQTLRGWLEDDTVIGPRSPEDLASIAKLTQHSALLRGLQECQDAISAIRVAHVRAGSILAGHVADQIQDLLSRGKQLRDVEDIIGHVVLVRVEEIDDDLVDVSLHCVNRVLGETPVEISPQGELT
jgi:hypothetical protein